MGVLITLTIGLSLWIIFWALGAKGIDSFVIPVALVVVAAAARLAILRAKQPGDDKP